MSGGKKKRKRRGPGPGGSASRPAVRKPEPSRRRPSSMLGSLFGGRSAGGSSPLPPMGGSLARGFLTVGSQPALLLFPFLVVGAWWLGLIALGMQASPGRIVNVLALPPVATYFDLSNGAAIGGLGTGGILYGFGFIVVRSVVTGALAGMVVEAFETGHVGILGVVRGLRISHVMFAINALSIFLILTATIFLQLLGPGLSFLGFVVALGGGVFFFSFVPAAAIREGRRLNETLRRAGRAAAIPGGRHVLMVMLYFLISLPIANTFVPGASGISANPTVATWVFGLLMTYVNVAFLAAFSYRWMVAEPNVPDQPLRRR